MTDGNKKGVSLLAIIILVLVFTLLLGGFFVLLNNERSKSRDAKRLSDITRLQAGFELLYNDTASYELAAINGCDKIGKLANQCNLSQYISKLSQISDPGKYNYVVSKVPDKDGYEITFTLENSYSGFKAGNHTLSPQGIK